MKIAQEVKKYCEEENIEFVSNYFGIQEVTNGK